jgi:hypothetical protein
MLAAFAKQVNILTTEWRRRVVNKQCSRLPHLMLTLLAGAALWLAPAQVQAGFIPGFAGNTQPTFVLNPGATVQGFIDAAVFQNSHSGTDSFGIGLSNGNAVLAAAGFNTNANFLYLYEISNKGTSNEPLGRMTISWVQALTNSGPLALAGFGFNDGTHNMDSTHPLGTAATPGNASPWSGTAANALVTSQSGLMAPTSFLLTTPLIMSAEFNAPIDTGLSSSLFGYTSDRPPTIVQDSIQDDVSANGFGPSVSTPEPSSIVLLLIGAPALGLFVRYRRRKAGALELERA